VGMETDADEKPTAADLIAGLSFTAGFFLLLGALPIGAFLALKSLPDGWSWRWFVMTGAAITATVAGVAMGLIFLSSAICRWQWGFWPDVFWSSRREEP